MASFFSRYGGSRGILRCNPCAAQDRCSVARLGQPHHHFLLPFLSLYLGRLCEDRWREGVGPRPRAQWQAADVSPMTGIGNGAGKRDAGRADAILIARSGLMTLRPAQSQVTQ
jgi:hypothetical protein